MDLLQLRYLPTEGRLLAVTLALRDTSHFRDLYNDLQATDRVGGRPLPERWKLAKASRLALAVIEGVRFLRREQRNGSLTARGDTQWCKLDDALLELSSTLQSIDFPLRSATDASRDRSRDTEHRHSNGVAYAAIIDQQLTALSSYLHVSAEVRHSARATGLNRVLAEPITGVAAPDPDIELLNHRRDGLVLPSAPDALTLAGIHLRDHTQIPSLVRAPGAENVPLHSAYSLISDARLFRSSELRSAMLPVIYGTQPTACSVAALSLLEGSPFDDRWSDCLRLRYLVALLLALRARRTSPTTAYHKVACARALLQCLQSYHHLSAVISEALFGNRAPSVEDGSRWLALYASRLLEGAGATDDGAGLGLKLLLSVSLARAGNASGALVAFEAIARQFPDHWRAALTLLELSITAQCTLPRLSTNRAIVTVTSAISAGEVPAKHKSRARGIVSECLRRSNRASEALELSFRSDAALDGVNDEEAATADSLVEMIPHLTRVLPLNRSLAEVETW